MIYSIDEIKKIVQPIAKKYEIEEVYLFGSYARGQADEKSDIDFVVKAEDNSFLVENYFDFLEEMETAFQKEIDITFYKNVYQSATRFENRFAPRFERDKVKVA